MITSFAPPTTCYGCQVYPSSAIFFWGSWHCPGFLAPPNNYACMMNLFSVLELNTNNPIITLLMPPFCNGNMTIWKPFWILDCCFMWILSKIKIKKMKHDLIVYVSHNIFVEFIYLFLKCEWPNGQGLWLLMITSFAPPTWKHDNLKTVLDPWLLFYVNTVGAVYSYREQVHHASIIIGWC
jgi:hypothetical protein